TGFGNAELIGIPLPVILVVLVIVCAWLALKATRFGMRTLAVGSSLQAAQRAGVKTDRHLVGLFTLMGFLVGLAAIVGLSRFGTTNVLGHQPAPRAGIAGTVIGGTSLFGGIASIGGAVVGALLPVVLGTGLVIMSVQSFYQQIVVGLILLLAIYLD